MKKHLLIGLIGLAPVPAFGQSAIDAYNMSPSELRGTARFMSMGGAFTALGGDLSTLNQNPAGIGVYRSSEIGVTLDIDFQSTETASQGYKRSGDQTKAACNNFGYVGSVALGNDVMPYFTWGASYGRTASFDRMFTGGVPSLSTSMSNYVASFTSGQTWAYPGDLYDDYNSSYNPYLDSYADWLSILAYNGYLINPVSPNSNQYNGLWQNGTTGDAMFKTRQKGYVDEYSIDFGGNIMNVLYWGVGFGITDLDFRSDTYYDEQLDGALISNAAANGTVTGSGGFSLQNWQHTTGNGFNFKAGLIVKPINEFRLGLAVHTPTYYDMTTVYDAEINYGYSSGIYSDQQPNHPSVTEVAGYDWKMRSPWRLMVGAAGVIGGRGIISMDYEYSAYGDMKVQDVDGNTYEDVTDDIKNCFQASNTIRLGAEYRVTPSFSIRAGFNYTTTDVKDEAADNRIPVYTSGTNPAYTLKKDTYHVTCGLGYRYKGFYADAAYVYRHRESTWHAFTPFESAGEVSYNTPQANLTENNSHLVLSVGYKF